MISPRENAIMELLDGRTPLCPYLFSVPAEGAHGPMTCPGSCYEEPCTTNGPFPVFDHPDLVDAIRVMLVGDTIDRHDISDDHPAFVWWNEHTGEDLLQ